MNANMAAVIAAGTLAFLSPGLVRAQSAPPPSSVERRRCQSFSYNVERALEIPSRMRPLVSPKLSRSATTYTRRFAPAVRPLAAGEPLVVRRRFDSTVRGGCPSFALKAEGR